MENQNIIKEIGCRIKQRREEREWSQTELARKFYEEFEVSITSKAVWKWENGGLPRIDTLLELSKLLGVTTDWLLTGDYTGNYKDCYKDDKSKNTRFVLRTRGNRPLVCVGLRPSTADDKESDKMTNKIIKCAKKLGFEGAIMLNLYPLRYDLPLEADNNLISENKSYIAILLNELFLEVKAREVNEITLLAAWGDFYDKRYYLGDSLRKIVNVAESANCRWKCLELTKDGHPCNPQDFDEDKMASLTLRDFDVNQYIEKGEIVTQ